MSTRQHPQTVGTVPEAPANLPEGECLPAAIPADSVSGPEEDRLADVRQVGVGLWPSGCGARPTDLCYDHELLADGDRRNVIDHYHYWIITVIHANLAAQARRLHIVIENASQDPSIGSIVRSASAFNMTGVHIVDRRRWNKHGAMVINRYLDVRHHPESDELLVWVWAEGYEVIGIDSDPGVQPLEAADLPERYLMVLGSEGEGVSLELNVGCSRLLRIGQYGSTRSVNVAVAAAMTMHSWILQHAGPVPG